MNNKNGKKPILCNNDSGFPHPRYFGCPECGAEVGGFIITGEGSDDWATHTDNFCRACGQKINWNYTQFSDIYIR